MRVFHSIEAIPPDEFAQGSAVAIGKFDGVHRGHQAILARLRDTSDASAPRRVVFTFVNNPLSFLRPTAAPIALMSHEQRLEAIAAEGVETCVMVDFDAHIAEIPADVFVEQVLVGQLHAKHIIMGSDFRFGHRGAGDAELLRRLGPVHGFTVEVVDEITEEAHGVVSSTHVREAIQAGDVEAAMRMLGRPVSVRGDVVHGDARGRELGFPTANLGGRIEGLVPADGVYAGSVVLDGVEYSSAISVGTNPTFTPDGQSRVEAFILDFDRDLYGHRIEVRFTHHLRDMVRFDSLDALIDQMQADVDTARELGVNRAAAHDRAAERH